MAEVFILLLFFVPFKSHIIQNLSRNFHFTRAELENFYKRHCCYPQVILCDDLITPSVSELDSWMASAISRRALIARRATRYRFLPPSRSRRVPVMPFPILTFVTGKPRGRAGKPWLETFDVKEMSTHPYPRGFLPLATMSSSSAACE